MMKAAAEYIVFRRPLTLLWEVILNEAISSRSVRNTPSGCGHCGLPDSPPSCLQRPKLLVRTRPERLYGEFHEPGERRLCGNVPGPDRHLAADVFWRPRF